MTSDYQNTPTVRVSLIIINAEGEILLAKHKKPTREYWVLPGGHLEYGETIQECALRELKEETNLDGEFKRIVFLSESIAPNGSRHIINFFVLVDVVKGEVKMGEEDVLAEIAYKALSEFEQLEVYPNVQSQIIQRHKEGWSSQLVEILNTPWS